MTITILHLFEYQIRQVTSLQEKWDNLEEGQVKLFCKYFFIIWKRLKGNDELSTIDFFTLYISTSSNIQ